MKRTKRQTPDATELRHRAEKRLKEHQTEKSALDSGEDDPRRLVHELQVHQIELKMQNEELQRARAEIEAGLERYTALYDFAPMGYVTLGRDGTILKANLTAERILGKARSQLVGDRLGYFVSAEHRFGFDSFLKKIFMSQTKAICELAMGTESALPPWVRIEALLSEAEQECRAVLVDITERKRGDAYRDLVGDVLRILNDPGEFHAAIKRVLATLKSGTGVDAVGLRLLKKGDYPYFAQVGFSEEHLSTESALLELSTGEAICRDGSSHERLECACGTVIAGGTTTERVLLTPGGSFWRNEPSIFLAIPPGENPRHSPRNCCSHQGFASVALVPIRSQGKNVGLIHLVDRRQGRFNIETVEHLEGIAAHIGAALLRMQAEEALRRSEQLSREAAQTLSEVDHNRLQFLAMLSHELRNPLAPIKSSLYILDRAALGGAQAKRAHAVLDRQVGQLSRLVDDLLDTTRLSSGKIHLKLERLDLNEVVYRTVEDHRTLFAKSGVGLKVTLADCPVIVKADWARIAQVFGNLLSNAAKFTGCGGSMHISVARDERQRQAVVHVVDNGAGISPEIVCHLFERFTQADRTLDRSKGGLGLGLALVKGLVEMHCGEVSANSAGPGQGAEFIVRLPLDAIQVVAKSEALSAESHGRRVLIIEDNVDAADSLGELLELSDHEIEITNTGLEGLKKALQFKPDVVLCDIGLPGMSGYDVARAFRADDVLKETFMVALSGYALPEDLERAANAGFNRHLAKPPSFEKLEQFLAEAPHHSTS